MTIHLCHLQEGDVGTEDAVQIQQWLGGHPRGHLTGGQEARRLPHLLQDPEVVTRGLKNISKGVTNLLLLYRYKIINIYCKNVNL